MPTPENTMFEIPLVLLLTGNIKVNMFMRVAHKLCKPLKSLVKQAACQSSSALKERL
jgi:hypothetical protein